MLNIPIFMEIYVKIFVNINRILAIRESCFVKQISEKLVILNF